MGFPFSFSLNPKCSHTGAVSTALKPSPFGLVFQNLLIGVMQSLGKTPFSQCVRVTVQQELRAKCVSAFFSIINMTGLHTSCQILWYFTTIWPMISDMSDAAKQSSRGSLDCKMVKLGHWIESTGCPIQEVNIYIY